MSLLAPYYPWLKTLHILSVIAWMAGMLYLPRLFVYHAGSAPGSPTSETFKTMERRLYRAIMTPAMVATWLFGIGLTLTGIVVWTTLWLYAKLVLVVAMTWLHVVFGRWRRAFAADERPHGAGFYRAINEVPTLLLIGIVILAVVKPL
ncbi:MAG: protoporphyrinogen oxidase HemJ [Stellaceae bacterium]